MTPTEAQDDETNWDRFWQASSLDRFNVADFARTLNTYDSEEKELSLAFPPAATPLPAAKSKLNKIAANRSSKRNFSAKPLSLKDLSLLLSSFQAWNGLEHRAYPSAGATYTTEIFVVCFNVEKYNNKILYYDAKGHGVVPLSTPAPAWETAAKSLNIEVTGQPQALVLFTTFPQRATAQYGERGGRFALLEAGAAMQTLALQIAETKSKLTGVAVGGTLDAVWLQLLGLPDPGAGLAVGYLVGRRA